MSEATDEPLQNESLAEENGNLKSGRPDDSEESDEEEVINETFTTLPAFSE